MSFADDFPTVDAMYASDAHAELALRSDIPGNKPARSDEIANRMVKAARRGLEDHYRQLTSYEWYRYIDKLEKAVERVGEPVFPKPEFRADAEPSETWQHAQVTIRSAQAHFAQVTATIRARQAVMEKFGKDVVDKTFLDNPRDGAAVMMVLEMLRDAFDGSYEDPQPVELALVAVIVGFERPLADGGPDGGENRRARWFHRLRKARDVLKPYLLPDPPGSRGR